MPELEGVELVAAVAEKVLGFDEGRVRGIRRGTDTWSPLTSMSTAWEIVDAMREQGWHIKMVELQGGDILFYFFDDSKPSKMGGGAHANPGEAICRAALAAIGGPE